MPGRARQCPFLPVLVLAACAGSGSPGEGTSCPADALACPDLPTCQAGEGADAIDPGTASPDALDEPRPTGHRGLVGVLDRSKAFLTEEGTILPQGLHPSEAYDKENALVLRPGGAATAWELVGASGVEPVAEIRTARDGLGYRARLVGTWTEPATSALRVVIENPSGQPRTASLQMGYPGSTGPFAFDGWALAANGEVRFLARPDDAFTCALDGAGRVTCRTDLAPGAARWLDVLVVHPESRGVVPAAFPCFPDLEAEGAASWRQALQDAATVSFPDPWPGAAYRRSLAHLLLLRDAVAGYHVVKPGAKAYNSFWYRDAAYIIEAMDQVGLHGFAEESLRLFWNRPLPREVEAMNTWDSRVAQYDDGRWECPNNEHDGTGQALWALVGHWLLGGDADWLGQAWPAIRNGAMWLVTARRQTIGGAHSGTAHEGLLPIGYGETLIDWDYVLNHDFWGVLGLRRAETAAEALGEAADAAAFREARMELSASIDAAVDAAFTDGYIQAAPGVTGSKDHGSIATLYPCEVLGIDDLRVTATFENLWANRVMDLYKFPDRNKVWTYITADWAQALLMRGEWQRAYTLFEGFRRQASPVLGWWEEIRLEDGVGTGDDPHGWAAANYVLWLRSMLFREDSEGGLEMLRGVPPSWYDEAEPIVAEGFPLEQGRLRRLWAQPDGTGAIRVEWDVLSGAGDAVPVTVFLRGRTITSAECDVGATFEGDHLRATAARGTCTLVATEDAAGSM